MQAVEGLSFFILIFATVLMAKMMKQYVDGIRSAGNLVSKFKCSPLNINMIFAVLALGVGSSDLIRGNYVFGGIIIIFGLWCVARGLMPHRIYEKGILIEMEYFAWEDLKSWARLDKNSSIILLNFENKPTKRVKLSQDIESFESALKEGKKSN